MFVFILLISVPAFQYFSNTAQNIRMPLLKRFMSNSPTGLEHGSKYPSQQEINSAASQETPVAEVAGSGGVVLMESGQNNLKDEKVRDICMVISVSFVFPEIIANAYENIKSEDCDRGSFDEMNLASARAQLQTITNSFQTYSSGPYRSTATKDLSASSDSFIYMGSQKYAIFFAIKIGFIDFLKHPQFALGGNLVNKALYYPLSTKQNLSLFWSPGEPIYCLVDPSGKHYLMTMYSAQLLEGLNRNNLLVLNKLLVVPPGWKFKRYELKKPIWLTRNVNDGYVLENVIDNLGNFYTRIELDNGTVKETHP